MTSDPAAAISVLLVDDDDRFRERMARALQKRGYDVRQAADAEAGLLLAGQDSPEWAVVDLRMPGDSGLTLIEPLRALRADMQILLVTGYASVATAVESIKRGADDYLPKPATVPTILRALGLETPATPIDDLEAAEDTMTPLSRLEWEHIQQALAETDGNISAAARLLGMHRRSLQRKLAKRPGPERRWVDE